MAAESKHTPTVVLKSVIVGPWKYEPQTEEVAQLILRAESHPLGKEFLQEGALDAVSAIFDVHAFVVDQARLQLASTDRLPTALGTEMAFPGQ